MNFFSNLFAQLRARFFTPSVAGAVADLDRAIIKLQRAENYHIEQAEDQLYIVEQANTQAALHEGAAIRAERIRSKLIELTA